LAAAPIQIESGIRGQKLSIRIMKTVLIAISLLLPLLALQAGERPAQPQSFATFWADFKSAVARKDKEAVVAATDLPSFYPN
jgi:hypothetical protein